MNLAPSYFPGQNFWCPSYTEMVPIDFCKHPLYIIIGVYESAVFATLAYILLKQLLK